MTVQDIISIMSEDELIDIRSSRTGRFIAEEVHPSYIGTDTLHKEVKNLISYSIYNNAIILLIVD